MKKILLKFINRYSLIYLPLGWIFGLVIFFIAFEPSFVLYILSFFVIGSFFGLYLFVIIPSVKNLKICAKKKI